MIAAALAGSPWKIKIQFPDTFMTQNISKVRTDPTTKTITVSLTRPKATLKLAHDPENQSYQATYKSKTNQAKVLNLDWISTKKIPKGVFVASIRELRGLGLDKADFVGMLTQDPLNIHLSGDQKTIKVARPFVLDGGILTAEDTHGHPVTFDLGTKEFTVGGEPFSHVNVYFSKIMLTGKQKLNINLTELSTDQAFWKQHKTAMIMKYHQSQNPVFKAVQAVVLKQNLLNSNITKIIKTTPHYQKQQQKIHLRSLLEKHKHELLSRCKHPGVCAKLDVKTEWYNLVELFPLIRPVDIIHAIRNMAQELYSDINYHLPEKPPTTPKPLVQSDPVMREFQYFLLRDAKYNDCAQALWQHSMVWASMLPREQLQHMIRAFAEEILRAPEKFKLPPMSKKWQDEIRGVLSTGSMSPENSQLAMDYFTTRNLDYLFGQFFAMNNVALNPYRHDRLMLEAVGILHDMWNQKNVQERRYWWNLYFLHNKALQPQLNQLAKLLQSPDRDHFGTFRTAYGSPLEAYMKGFQESLNQGTRNKCRNLVAAFLRQQQ